MCVCKKYILTLLILVYSNFTEQETKGLERPKVTESASLLGFKPSSAHIFNYTRSHFKFLSQI
jgi:hypothetical protein